MKIDDILLSLDPNIKQCDRCKKWFIIQIMHSIYNKLVFGSNGEKVPSTCIICGWSHKECRRQLLLHDIYRKDLEKAFCDFYSIRYNEKKKRFRIRKK